MKKGIYSLLILFAFSLSTFQGTAQSLGSKSNSLLSKNLFNVNPLKLNQNEFSKADILASNSYNVSNLTMSRFSSQNPLMSNNLIDKNERTILVKPTNPLINNSFINNNVNNTAMKTSFLNSEWYNKNRRNIYSSLWAYASLNYLYADLIQFMDKNEHLKYHTGTVNGFEMTPGFLAGSAAFMQIAIANVFLPQIIKNDKTLRWVQIASGTIMTLVQSATLFATKPTPYYMVLSGFEIAATAYITFDAIKWKPKQNKVKN
jgi:hypothetical protein